eukprot:546770-Pelagomonas_calceolata.AAC.1
MYTEHQPHEAGNNGSKPSQAHTSAKPPQSAPAGQTQGAPSASQQTTTSTNKRKGAQYLRAPDL